MIPLDRKQRLEGMEQQGSLLLLPLRIGFRLGWFCSDLENARSGGKHTLMMVTICFCILLAKRVGRPSALGFEIGGHGLRRMVFSVLFFFFFVSGTAKHIIDKSGFLGSRSGQQMTLTGKVWPRKKGHWDTDRELSKIDWYFFIS